MGMFGVVSKISIAMVLDGTSNTVMMSERCQGIQDRRNEVISNLGMTSMPDSYIDPKRSGNNTDMDTIQATCQATVANGVYTAPYTNEIPGQRWIDGGYFYVGFSTTLPPGSPSCMDGGWDRTHMTISASSRHTGLAQTLLADGSVRTASNNIDRLVWRAAGTRAGGETQGDW